MFYLWMIFCLLIACLMEVVLALHSLALPLLLATAFYFSCLLPWQKGFLPCFIAAGLLDSWFARTFPSTGASLLAILLFAGVWKRFGNLNSLFSLLIPGSAIGLISALFLLLNRLLSGGQILASTIVFSGWYFLFSLVLLPLLWWIMENGARLLALRRQEIFSPGRRTDDFSAQEDAADE